MNNSIDIKSKLINVTKELMKNSDGDISKITIRSIAEKSNVGVGLVNYHFQNKDNLIEICVQEMIGDVVKAFKPNLDSSETSMDRITSATKQVMDFLVSNEAISRISILSDMRNPSAQDNSTKTMQGFLSIFSNEMNDLEAKKLCFALTSILQVCFLRRNSGMEFIGLNMFNKDDRDNFIDFIVRKLFSSSES